MTGKLPSQEISRREKLSINWTYMLNVGLRNLHKCLWIGIAEDLEKSFKMLKYQTGLNIKMNKLNVNKNNIVYPTQKQMLMLENLLPIDMYLYNYAKQIHDHRYEVYLRQRERNIAISHSYPTAPSTIRGCKSTRFFLECPSLHINFSYKPNKTWLERIEKAIPIKNSLFKF